MLPSDLRHHVGWPVLQALQMPQLARVLRTTCWPGLTEVTPAPTSATMPAPSWPSTDGAGHGMVPSSTLTSLWQRPALVTWTLTSPGPGSFTSTPSATEALAPSNTMALTELMLRQRMPPPFCRGLLPRRADRPGRIVGLRPAAADPVAERALRGRLGAVVRRRGAGRHRGGGRPVGLPLRGRVRPRGHPPGPGRRHGHHLVR